MDGNFDPFFYMKISKITLLMNTIIHVDVLIHCVQSNMMEKIKGRVRVAVATVTHVEVNYLTNYVIYLLKCRL